MSGYIARALIEDATWKSIQARPYDGTRYPCGCHPDPKEPHRRFYLCDYHDGFDAGVDQGCHDLTAERDASRRIANDMTVEVHRLRAEVVRLTDELQQVANEIALAESEEARREK